MPKIRVKVKCTCCGVFQGKTFNVVEEDQPVEWTCPECGAKTTLNFGKLDDVRKLETKSDYVARVPKAPVAR